MADVSSGSAMMMPTWSDDDDMSDDSYTRKRYPIKMSKNQLAAAWYVARLIRGQSTLMATLGFLALGTAVCWAVGHVAEKSSIVNLTVLGSSLNLIGVSRRQKAIIAERATCRELLRAEHDREAYMTPAEARVTQAVSDSWTMSILTAMQPLDNPYDCRRLLHGKAYQVWKKWLIKHLRTR